MTVVVGPVALQGILQEKEGENLEFKEAKSRFGFDDLAKYCCALANEGGGRIVLGVSDARPRKVVGSQAFEQPERTRRGLIEKIPLAIDFEEIPHPDGRVLVFSVPSRPVGVPIKYDGRYWVRKADGLGTMPEDRLRKVFAESGHDFSADVCAGLTVGDLDPAAVEAFRARWIEKARKTDDAELANRLGSLTVEELLADAEAIGPHGLTYASLILFGTPKAVGQHLAQAEIVFEYRSSDASGPAQDRWEYRQGFLGIADDLWNRINLRNDKQDFQEGLFVTPISTFGERSVREAILNAVSHRNYQLGGSIFVRQFPRRLEIDSPGGLPYGVSLETILDRQNPRNRRIAEIFTRCGLVERSGQGMNLIYEELIKQSKPAPDFERTDTFQVGLTLHGTIQDPGFVQFVEKVTREFAGKSVHLGTHDWLLLSTVGRGDRLPKGLEGRAAKLLDLGLIERIRGRTYLLSRRYYEFIGRKGEYTRARGLDRDQNLALLEKHITENQAEGARMEDLCQVLSTLPRTTVRSLLRTLKKSGRAHFLGSSRQTRWFPGPDSKRE